MKKSLLTAAIVTFQATLSALPIGNPADPMLYTDGVYLNSCELPFLNWVSVRGGFYGDYALNHHLKRSNNEGAIDELEISTNAGFIAFNFFNRIDLFGTLGASKAFVSSNSNLRHFRFELDYATDLSWSIGTRIALFEYKGAILGIEGQYFAFQPDIKRFTHIGENSIYQGNRTQFKEWQFGFAIAQRICNFVPYAGVKWSCIHVNNQHFTFEEETIANFKSSDYFGYAIGLSILDIGLASVTVEARFLNDKGLYANVQLRF